MLSLSESLLSSPLMGTAWLRRITGEVIITDWWWSRCTALSCRIFSMTQSIIICFESVYATLLAALFGRRTSFKRRGIVVN